LNPCDPQWDKRFCPILFWYFYTFLLALKKEKDLFQFFSLRQFQKEKNYLQFGKEVRVGYLQKGKRVCFSSSFLIS
jgi:hypothetical protein